MARRTGILASFAIAAGIAITVGVGPAHAIIDIPPLKQPEWHDLTPKQQEILKPLAGEWNNLEPGRRKKWGNITQRYPSMNAEEKNRVQQNMLEWVRLTPAQRKQARENFKSLHNAHPQQQQAVLQKWQSYRELPSEEKERLRQQAQQKKALGKLPESKPSGAMSPQHHLQAIRKPPPSTTPQPEISAATVTPAAPQPQPAPPATVAEPAAPSATSP